MNFLFQITEQLRVEEVLNGNSQTIAEFLDRGYSSAAVSSADNVVYCGLGHTAHAAEYVVITLQQKISRPLDNLIYYRSVHFRLM